MESSILSLPNEVLQYLFSFTDIKTIAQIILVCKLWNSIGDSSVIWKTFAIKAGITVHKNNWKESLRADTIAKMAAKLRPLFDSARTGASLTKDKKNSIMRRIRLINNEMSLKSDVKISSDEIQFHSKNIKKGEKDIIVNFKLSTKSYWVTYKVHVPAYPHVYDLEVAPMTGDISSNTTITFKLRPKIQSIVTQVFDISIFRKKRIGWGFRSVSEFLGVFTIGVEIDTFFDPNISFFFDSRCLHLIKGPSGSDENLKSISTVNLSGKILLLFPAPISISDRENTSFSSRIPILGVSDKAILVDSDVLAYPRLDKVLMNKLEYLIKIKIALDITLIIREMEEKKFPFCLHPKNFSVVSLDPKEHINVIVYNPFDSNAFSTVFGAWGFQEFSRESRFSTTTRLRSFGALLWTIFTQKEFDKKKLLPSFQLSSVPEMTDIPQPIESLIMKCFGNSVSIEDILQELEKLYTL